MPKKPVLAKPALADLLNDAALPEKTVEVCLRGDLLAEVEDLERELRDARISVQTMADQGRARKIAEQIEKAREAMREASVVFRLRGLTRKAWAGLVGAHPPRKDNDTDRALGYNMDTFFPALIRACVTEPELNDETWERLDPALSSAQFDELVDAALAVSRRRVDVPFSYAASVTLQSSGETSKQPSA
jgi:hypothetical protein